MVLQQFDEALASVGKRLGDFRSILDYGVGCGRVIRRFWELYPDANLTGADIDAEAIAWLQHNYAKMGKFVVLSHLPRSPFPDETFDLVYGISVFTHLNEEMQFAWLAELQRITSPGGCLTVHGRNHHTQFSQDIQRVLADKGFLFLCGISRHRGLAGVL